MNRARVQAPATAEPRWDVEGYDRINAARLETFPYEYPDSDAVVEITTDEFTAVCPWSGLPDFGRLTVRYVPRERVLELKSFKYYLHSYRNVGIYQEHAANRILRDLIAAAEPRWMELVLDYNIRGGVHTTVSVRWPQAAADGPGAAGGPGAGASADPRAGASADPSAGASAGPGAGDRG